MSAKHNGHASREQLALEVQAEALRPTPVKYHSLQERLNEAWQRIRYLEDRVNALLKQRRENQAQFRREIAKQRRELGIRDSEQRL